MSLYAVILCGGKGERFWPKSRTHLPKQFLRLFGRDSLIKATSNRIKKLCPLDRQFFVTSERFAGLIEEEIGVSRASLLLEPAGKNTAPAIGFAAAVISRLDPAGVMVVLPSDHLIAPQADFLRSVQVAAAAAEKGYLVTFGIVPLCPDTGYGYIHLGEELMRRRGLGVYRVLEFREKPDQKTAIRYVRGGDFLWNSGMFIWRVDTILAAFERYLPDFYSELLRFQQCLGTEKEKPALRRLYRKAPAISIDYAIMEKADNVAVIKAGFNWDDVGSWLALARHFPADASGNVKVGLSFNKDTRDSLIYADEGVIVTLGVTGLVVVRSQDAVLVADKRALGAIKDVLAQMGKDPKGKRFL